MTEPRSDTEIPAQLANSRAWILDSYLAGEQDGSGWALIDNSDADDVRHNLETAIERLSAALAAKEAAEEGHEDAKEFVRSNQARADRAERHADSLRRRVERAEAQRDEALTLLADAIPDPKGAMDSPQWHRRMDALAHDERCERAHPDYYCACSQRGALAAVAPSDPPDRCEHVAYIGRAVRCDLPLHHDGQHRGLAGTRDGWTHAADAPSYTPPSEPQETTP